MAYNFEHGFHGWLKNYETMIEEVLDSVSRTCKCNGGHLRSLVKLCWLRTKRVPKGCGTCRWAPTRRAMVVLGCYAAMQ